MTDAKLKEIEERAAKSTPGVFAKIDQCVEMFWINPWSQETERLCMVMWPAHPVEVTKLVEDWFENMGALWAHAREDVPDLVAEVNVARRSMEALDTATECGKELAAENARLRANLQNLAHAHSLLPNGKPCLCAAHEDARAALEGK